MLKDKWLLRLFALQGALQLVYGVVFLYQGNLANALMQLLGSVVVLRLLVVLKG